MASTSVSDTIFETEYAEEEEDEGDDGVMTKKERKALCRAFTLLDTDGDGVIDPDILHQFLISLGRLPMDNELEYIMSHVNGTGCEGAEGMDFEGFEAYFREQLEDTRDENKLREAFEAFDSTPPTGKLNVTELRHYLKHMGLKLTDDEIDFLYKEEDYWMLEEKNIFEYEHLINKILDKPICNSPFLDC